MKTIGNYFLVGNRVIFVCEVVLVIILVISVANLVTEVIQLPGFLQSQSTLESTLPPNMNNFQDTNGLNELDIERRAVTNLKGLFGIPIASQQKKINYKEGELQQTKLQLNLKGILVNSQTDVRLALIASSDNLEKVYHIGDEVEGAEIVGIEPRRVILKLNGVIEALNLKVPKFEQTVTQKKMDSNAGFPVGATGIQKLNDKNSIISEQSFRRQLNDMPKLLTQAKAVPYASNGQNIGFKIVNLEVGSVFQEMGLQQEDVISAVNGIPIKTNRDAMNAYRELRTVKSFQLELLRDNRKVMLNLSVQ